MSPEIKIILLILAGAMLILPLVMVFITFIIDHIYDRKLELFDRKIEHVLTIVQKALETSQQKQASK